MPFTEAVNRLGGYPEDLSDFFGGTLNCFFIRFELLFSGAGALSESFCLFRIGRRDWVRAESFKPFAFFDARDAFDR